MFGQLVRKHRRRLGLSQEELAASAGLNPRTIGKLETDHIAQPRPVTVRLLADVFGLTGGERDAFCAAAAETVSTLDRGSPERDAPAQLPAEVTAFTGRDDALARLDELLEADRRAGVMIVSGTAGVGKTALALHWGHRVLRRYRDGQLYANLHGFGPTGRPLDAGDVLRGFLVALGVAGEAIPVDAEARAALYRTTLAHRKVLVLLDNARDAAQVRPLLPGADGCAVVVTSRDQLAGLVGADGCLSVELDLFPEDQARALLERRLGAARLAAEPEAAADVLAHCAGLPLALVIVAARAAAHPHLPLAATAEALRETQGTLEALGGRDAATDLRTVFSWSYTTLSPGAARLFRRLGLHRGPDIAPPAAASLLGTGRSATRHALAELADAHLVAESVPGRYRLHDLLHDYAAELVSTLDSEPERQRATGRLLDHYLHSGHAAATAIHPHRDAIEIGQPDPGVCVVAFADVAQARTWFTAEHRALLGAMEIATDGGFTRHVWQLAWTLEVFFSRSGHWHDWVATQSAALEAMTQLDDPAGQARAYRSIGTAYIRLHRHDDAYRYLTHARDLFAGLGDTVGLAHTRYHLGRVCEVQGRHAEMLDHSLAALDLYRAARHTSGQARALNLLGWQRTLTGSHREALIHCEEALALHVKLDDRRSQADTWDSLGYAHHHLGECGQAIACYDMALALYREFGARYGEAKTLTRLADTHESMGDTARAESTRRIAAAIFEQLGHPDGDPDSRRFAQPDH